MKKILWVMLFLCAFALYAEVLFFDNFERAEGSAVGNSWTNIGPVSPVIENGSMKVTANSLQGVRRDFTSLGITSGIYYISYDWKITSNNWLADAFPNGTITYLRHDYEGNLYYDNTSDFSNPITIGSLATNTWANFKLKVNIDTDRFSIWLNNILIADNIAGLAVSDFTRFTFRAGSGSTVTQYIDDFIVYNDIPPATPTSLSAVGAVNNINLSWTGTPQDFLTYKIYRKTTSPADVFLAEVPGTQTSYVDNTADPNTDYKYRVKAISLGIIESNYSNEVDAHLQPQANIVPTEININVGYGYCDSTNVTITNNGNYPLYWEIQDSGNILSDVLTIYYNCNGNALDASGNNNDGIVNGPVLTSDRVGSTNSAYLFNGSTDEIVSPNLGIANNFSFSCWINPIVTHQIDPEGGGEGDGQRFVLFPSQGDWTWGNGSAGVGLSAGTNGVSVYEHSSSYFPAVLVWQGDLIGWNMVTVVCENHHYKLFINGELVRERTHPTSRTLYAPYLIGGIGLPEWPYIPYPGGFDEYALYSRALAGSEIHSLYASYSHHIGMSDVSGVVNASNHQQTIVRVSAQNLSIGLHVETLNISTNDPVSHTIPITVTINVTPPIPSLTPTSYEVRINADNAIRNIPLQITNSGRGILHYHLKGSDNLIGNNVGNYSYLGLFNNHRYYLSNNSSTWTDAKLSSIMAGGHLATITSEPENTFISTKYSSQAWIGLTDEDQEGIFKWVTNEPLIYSKWWSGQPDDYDGGEDYVETNYGDIGYWNDQKNDHSFGNYLAKHILEIDQSVVSSVLSFPQDSGYIDANSTLPLVMYVNGASLSEGIYDSNVVLHSNALAPGDSILYPVVIKVDFSPPSQPMGFIFEELQSDMNHISLSWTSNALADSVQSYNIYRRGLHDNLWSLKGSVDADHNWFMDDQFTGLDTTAVYYKITAVDWVDNESAASEEVMAWLQRFPAPTGLTMEIIRDRHVKLTWNPVTQTISGNPGTPSCYVIYRSNTPSPIEDFYFVGAVDATTFTHNWAAWFIDIGKQFYVVTAYSGSFDDLRAIEDSRREWKYGELEQVLMSSGTKTGSPKDVVQ